MYECNVSMSEMSAGKDGNKHIGLNIERIRYVGKDLVSLRWLATFACIAVLRSAGVQGNKSVQISCGHSPAWFKRPCLVGVC